MPDSKQKAVVDKIEKAVADSDGSVTKADEWGKKELAYKIKHEKEGFYYFFELSLPPDRTGGVNRMIENDEQVLRHLLVVKSTKSVKGNTSLASSGRVITTGETKEPKNEETKKPVDKGKKKGKIGKGKK